MSLTGVSIVLTGLDVIGYGELVDELPNGSVNEIAKPPVTGGRHGEPGTIAAALILTAACVEAFSTWLGRRRADMVRPAGQPAIELEVREGGTVHLHLGPPAPQLPDPEAVNPAELADDVEEVIRAIRALMPPGV